jgi:hypothetical protein
MASFRRSDYLSDRIFRLLSALLDDTAVRPIDPDLAELFEEEARLGRMPLRDAFQQLAALEPGLSEFPEAAPPIPKRFTFKMSRSAPTSPPKLVGAEARSRNPILMSDISASIVRQYVAVSTGEVQGDLSESYFDRPAMGVFTASSLGRRPNATN